MVLLKVEETIKQELELIESAASVDCKEEGRKQGLYSIIRLCVLTKATYVVRCLPPSNTSSFATRVDNLMMSTVDNILGLHLSDQDSVVRERLRLPIKAGGLSLTSIANTAKYAFAGSIALTAHIMQDLHPDLLGPATAEPDDENQFQKKPKCLKEMDKIVDDLCKSELTALDDQNAKNSEPLLLFKDKRYWNSPIHKVQASLSDTFSALAVTKISKSIGCDNDDDKAFLTHFFNSSTMAHSGAWLNPHNGFYANKLSDDHFTLAVLLRLGGKFFSKSQQPSLDSVASTCRGCKRVKVVSEYAAHAHNCRKLTQLRTTRHTEVKIALRQLARQHIKGIQVINEPFFKTYFKKKPNAVDADKLRPDLFMAMEQCQFLPHMIDVAVVLPESRKNNSRVRIEIEEKKKRKKYCSAYEIPDERFMTPIYDLAGHGSRDASRIVHLLADLAVRSSDRPGSYSRIAGYMYQHISTAIQRGVAKDLRAFLGQCVTFNPGQVAI